jgi:ATP-binding cassette subfamily C (CFTR/MRP) protein 1
MTAYTSGSIYIDSQSLSHVPHQDLRTALSVVPQEPALLSASIRLNIDPYSTHTNAEVEMFLRKVGLWGKVKDTYGTEEEINVKEFSFGQKQLLCLARALVKRRRILVLDESTSRYVFFSPRQHAVEGVSWLNSVALNSVDTATDRSIHKLVCEDLKDITVISVMHRLENVELYDMVAVLEEGRLVEFGRPKELLSDPASAFSGLYLHGTDS